jgi:Tfp pilus assembly protein PilE
MKFSATTPFCTPARRRRGASLIECLVYIGVLFVVLAVAGAAYARVLDHVRQVRRVAADIARALEAGERWRADVRGATAPPRLVTEGPIQALHLPGPDAEVVYLFDGSNVVRRAGTNAPGQTFLPRVKASRFVPDPRQHITAWRWDVELQPGPRPGRTPPWFSFLAVANPKTAP